MKKLRIIRFSQDKEFMGIDLYVGINETKWNHHPVEPGQLACIAPVYGRKVETRRENRVNIPASTAVTQDSGAFSDGPGQRLTFPEALERQKGHAKKYNYQVLRLASYDLLIDEKWDACGQRHKRRWSENEAEAAVTETVEAARFLAQHRNGTGLILSVQGVVARQYLECVRCIIPLIDPERDTLGLGGWCINGKMPTQMMPTFRETIRLVIPFVAKEGIKSIHIWGVIYAPALGELLWLCNQFGIKLSTDSAGPSWRPAFGEWGYADWKDKTYQIAPVETRGLDRARHVEQTRLWLQNLEESQYYREPKTGLRYIQTELVW